MFILGFRDLFRATLSILANRFKERGAAPASVRAIVKTERR
jgi:hypothetical protein